MTLVRWKPFGDFDSTQGRINRLFEEGCHCEPDGHTEAHGHTGAPATWNPTTDIYETRDDYVLKLEVPGLSKEDVKIEVNHNSLSIKGEKKVHKEIKKENYFRIESRQGSFCRNFELPKNADAKKINALIKDGMLKLRIAKAEEKKPKAIAITS
ncbi:MAG: Hsp20/alpha crystallin family protein [bacterium]|nr:Hsp20/alpha crystallin family protein [bacterium]